MLAMVIVLGLLCDWAETGLPIQGIRRIAIPSRDNDYGRIQSQVIDSQAKLDALLKPLNRKNEFEARFYEATGRALPQNLVRTQGAIQEALKSYAAKPYPGAMTLFRATNQPLGAIANPLGTVRRPQDDARPFA